MNTRDAVNASALLAVAGAMIAAVAMSVRQQGPGAGERERCYGVSRAGSNDCANAVHSCAKQGPNDGDLREWVAVPRGTCLRLAGGRIEEQAP